MADLSQTPRPLPLLFVATERAMKQTKRARTSADFILDGIQEQCNLDQTI